MEIIINNEITNSMKKPLIYTDTPMVNYKL